MSAWWMSRSIMAAAVTSSPKISPQRSERVFGPGLLSPVRHAPSLRGGAALGGGLGKDILSDADDTFLGGFDMPGDATASLEASSCATGWKGRHRLEINGTEGSAWWDMEEFNKLHVMFVKDQEEGVGGFRDVLVTER